MIFAMILTVIYMKTLFNQKFDYTKLKSPEEYVG